MLAIRLPNTIEKRLTRLAEQTGRTKTFYAREAILSYLEDMEDIYIANKRLHTLGKFYSQKEVEKALGLDNSVG